MKTINNTLTEVDPRGLIELINNSRVGRFVPRSSLDTSNRFECFDAINYRKNIRANDDYDSMILFI